MSLQEQKLLGKESKKTLLGMTGLLIQTSASWKYHDTDLNCNPTVHTQHRDEENTKASQTPPPTQQSAAPGAPELVHRMGLERAEMLCLESTSGKPPPILTGSVASIWFLVKGLYLYSPRDQSRLFENICSNESSR